MTTPKLDLDEVAASQTQPEVPINASLRTMDVLVQCNVLSRVSALPGSPTEGDTYILTAVTGGGQVGDIAYYSGGWKFASPALGWMAYVIDEAQRYEYTGGSPSAWATFSSGGGTPGGSTTQIQYNLAGAFAGSAKLTWDNTNGYLTIGNVTTPNVTIRGYGTWIGSSSSVYIYGGDNTVSGNGSAFIQVQSGLQPDGGNINLLGGNSDGGGFGGAVNIQAGDGDGASNSGGGVFVYSGRGANTADPGVVEFYVTDQVGEVADVAIDILGNLGTRFGRVDLGYQLETPTNGATVTIADTTCTLLLNPAGTIATMTLNMPAAPVDGQEVRVGTSQTITALTMSGNGATLRGGLSTLTALTPAQWMYELAGDQWIRIA